MAVSHCSLRAITSRLQSLLVDTYTASQKAQSAAYSSSGLSPGAHTSMIVLAGACNPASVGSWIWVDAFDVM